MTEEQMVIWTRDEMKIPKRTSPINFAVQFKSGLTSNAWGVKVENTGDAYVYCRDHMKGQKASLHASGKQHISFDEGVVTKKSFSGTRFMNRWLEPQYDQKAIATLQLLFPIWGLSLNDEKRDKSKAIWNKNHILIEGDDELMTVVAFVIMDDEKTLRKEEGSPPSYPIGFLRLRPGKFLYVIAGKAPDRHTKIMAEKALRQIAATTEPQKLFEGDLSICLTGYSSINSNFMLPLSVPYTPEADS